MVSETLLNHDWSGTCYSLWSLCWTTVAQVLVPHTYSVTQPLPLHVYLWRNGQLKITQIHVDTHGLEISLFLSSQLPPKSFNHRDILDYTPQIYSTHILSSNYCHPMCICEAIGTEKSLKLTFIQTVSTFHCFYALSFRQSPSMIEICRIEVHVGTTHIRSHNH